MAPKPGDIVAGKYRIESKLGSGGMSEVFEATHLRTKGRFAIKWMLPEIAQQPEAAWRFIRESQVNGRVRHPSVVEVFDLGEEGGAQYMVMEYLDGEPLSARVARCTLLPLAEACAILVPCMKGVAAAHAAGIVHRDLKPGNIFLCRAAHDVPERAKVLDFGISKLSPLAGEAASYVTVANAMMGTPYYMSPEQMRGAGAVDHRSDIYAFGVILYQLLSGRLPFDVQPLSALVIAVATGSPPPERLTKLVPGLPPAVDVAVARAMALDPAQRHPDLSALIAELEPFAAGAMFGASPSPSTPPRPSASAAPASASAAPRPAHGGSTVSLSPPAVDTVQPVAIANAAAPDAAPARARALYLGLMLLAAAGVLLWLRNARPADSALTREPEASSRYAPPSDSPAQPAATAPDSGALAKPEPDPEPAAQREPERAASVAPELSREPARARPRREKPKRAEPSTAQPPPQEAPAPHNPLKMRMQ